MMSEQPRSQSHALVIAGVGLALGVVAAMAMPVSSWDGLPAPPSLATIGSIVTLVAYWFGSRLPFPMLVWLGIVVTLALVGSFAVGSSWAALTWLPLVTAGALLARTTPWFLLGLTVTILVRDAPTLVILGQVWDARAHSGSVQYYVAFAGAVLVPTLLGVASAELDTTPFRRLLWLKYVILGSIGGLAVWAVFVSGSRSALVALIVGIVVSVASVAVARAGAQMVPQALAVVGLSVAFTAPIDIGLSSLFGDGRPIALDVLTSRFDDTTAELDRGGPGSITTRFAFWRQATQIFAARPIGHGPASYGHVNHAYQTEPLLWSGSPHNIWALAAVETGAIGLAALSVLFVMALVRGVRQGSMMAGALVAATTVMSLDVFASMPAQSTIWWAALGASWGMERRLGAVTPMRRQILTAVPIVLMLTICVWMSLRLGSPCPEDCDPVAYYAGNPRLTGAPSAIVDGASDGTWHEWERRYPYAFWLASSRARVLDQHSRVPRAGTLELLRAYPYQSLERYAVVARSTEDTAKASAIATCGLTRFFDQGPMWRDWRSSQDAIAQLRAELKSIANGVVDENTACASAGLNDAPVALR